MKCWSLGAAALLAACSAGLPPPELVDARVAYARADTAAARAYEPNGLAVARGALNHAEQAFRDHGATGETRALAYTALRQADTTAARASAALARREARIARKEAAQLAAQLLREGRRAPRSTSEALAYTSAELARQDVARSERTDEAAATVEALRRVVPIRDRGDGYVVRLSGPALFRGESAHLDAAALPKLDAVARAIEAGDPDLVVRIESHADSGRWGDYYDKRVAQERANAVAAYLASRGIGRGRITAVGYAPRHVPREAAAYDLRGLDRRIDIAVARRVLVVENR